MKKVIILYFLITLIFRFIINQINDNFQLNDIEGEDGNTFLDITDNNDLKLLISTSKIIYQGIPPTKKSTTNANLGSSSSALTINENYILVSCLNDSLLTKININNGEYSSLVSYSDILTSTSLSVPSTICSISLFENMVFIGYAQVKDSNKTNIVIRINIKDKDSTSGPIKDTSSEIIYFIFPNQYVMSKSIRQIICEVIYIINDESKYRLVCAYEILSGSQAETYAVALKNNLQGIDSDEYRISKLSSSSGFRIYKIDSSHLRFIVRKYIFDLHLEYNNGFITLVYPKHNSNLSSFSAQQDCFDYKNNFLVSAELYSKNFMSKKKFYYFRINKQTSSNYYKIYIYDENPVSRLLSYYNETNDWHLVIFRGKTTIRYFLFKNNKKFYEIDSFNSIIRLKSNETTKFNIENLFNFSSYGNLQVETKRTYSTSKTELNLGGDYFKSYLVDSSNELTTEESINNWYEYIFAFVDNKTTYARVFEVPNVKLNVRVCSYQCKSCSQDYYICDDCRNETFAKLKNVENSNCYPINMRIKGYLYNSNTKLFEECYTTCNFCSKTGEDSSSSNHNCESCKEGYAPSYEYLGNCYQINENEVSLDKKANNITDTNFTLVDSCSKYKINSTGECIDICPTTSTYYNFVSINNINLTEIEIDNFNEDNYLITNIVPKYLFNNVCYDICPTLTKYNDTTNKCVCEYSFHIEKEITTCYEYNYCINKTYKYHLNDSKQCISGSSCPSNYYQFNFQCYNIECPSGTSQDSENNYKCLSNYNYCYINKFFQNICNNTLEGEYIYKFDDTVQYLKSCDDSLVYTTSESKTYFYNNTCYLTCPENTVINISSNKCDCEFFGYYQNDDNYTCYSNEEKCKEKIPVNDLKICLDTINECRLKQYKIFNNECYSQECPNNTKIDNNDENKCVCSYYYYNYTNNTLNCFENLVTCESKNFTYSSPEIYECYNSLDDCFQKGNLFYFNNFCYKVQCPVGKIALSDINEQIKNYFINVLSLNDELKDKLCICDITKNGTYWNKTESNEIECLESCGDGYEPELLTKKCVEKCDPSKHFNFNDQCYIESCPSGTKLNTTENEKKICICEGLYYINETNNYMVCCNNNNIALCLNVQTTSAKTSESTIGKSIESTIAQQKESTILQSIKSAIVQPIESTIVQQKKTTILQTVKATIVQPIESTIVQSIKSSIIKSKESSIIDNIDISNTIIKTQLIYNYSQETFTNNNEKNILEIIYPEKYYQDPDNCLAVYENECYLKCPENTCLTLDDENLIYCIQIQPDYYVFNDICFTNFDDIINNLKNISDSDQTISFSQGIFISVYTSQTTNKFLAMNSNLSAIFLNECEKLLIDYYNLTNDTTLYIVGIDSPNKDKKYVIYTYNFAVFLENGYQLDHLNVCKDTEITISSPIKDTDSIKLIEAIYFSDMGYDIYNLSDKFYTDHCSSASINSNDITLDDRLNDFYPSNLSLCNDSCIYSSINFTEERFVCKCNLSYNFSEDYDRGNNPNKDNNINNDKNISYLDYFLSQFNYQIFPCYKLLIQLSSYNNNFGFYISVGTIVIYFIQIIVYITLGVRDLKKQILNEIPNKYKLKKNLQELRLKNIKLNTIKNNKNNNKKKNVNYFNFIYINQNKSKNPPKKNYSSQLTKRHGKKTKTNITNKKRKFITEKRINKKEITKTDKNTLKNKKEKSKKKVLILEKDKNNNNQSRPIKKINIFHLQNRKRRTKNFNTTSLPLLNMSNSLNSNNNNNNSNTIKKAKKDVLKNIKHNKFFELSNFGNDKSVDKKELNYVPYTQALRIDNRNFSQILVSILANQIKIISLFYYKNPYLHLSLSTSIYIFELLLDLTINCYLYTDDYVSEKYKNGKLKLLTSILLSLMSNIVASIISYFANIFLNFTELLEMIIKNVVRKDFYFLLIIKFKKYMILKLLSFYCLEFFMYILMCYYLTIFCSVYQQTQGSILINYIIGIMQSLLISFILSVITASLRFISIKLRIKVIYNTSKYLFEKF